MIDDEEGCLSFPEIYADIARPESVEVTALVPLSEVSRQGVPLPLFASGGAAADWGAVLRVGLAGTGDQADPWHLERLAAVPASWARLLHQFEQVFAQEANPGKPALAGQEKLKNPNAGNPPRE